MTTRECVHTVTTGSYFRSRKKDGGHAIRSAVGENPMLYVHLTIFPNNESSAADTIQHSQKYERNDALCVIDTELLA